MSQPLHTAHALRVLDAIGRCGGQRVERMCRYLTDVSTPDGALPALLPSQRGYPAAPLIPVVDDPPSDLLATGPVVGLLHRNEVWHAWLFRATDFCWAAVDALEDGAATPYEIEAAVAFLDGVPDRARAEAAADRLGRLRAGAAAGGARPERAEPVPACRRIRPGRAPLRLRLRAHSRFARPPGSPTRRWSVRWTSWPSKQAGRRLAGPPRGWAPGTALESRPIVTIEALLTLRAYGREM